MNKTSVVLGEIKVKLYEKLKESGWADKLKTFLLSSDFDNILQELYKQSQGGLKFTPPIKYLFRAFEECPYKSLKVVFIGQDPYPKIGVADGMTLSCSLSPIQTPLNYVFEAIDRTVTAPWDKYDGDKNLTRWANQGVLLLNSTLTTTAGTTGTHYTLWKPFMDVLFDVLAHNNTGIIYILMGKVAMQWAEGLNEFNHVIAVAHPTSAGYFGGTWDCKDLFNKINEILQKTNNEVIIW